eukprot:1063982-Pyramimonas_sp.AAC.1
MGVKDSLQQWHAAEFSDPEKAKKNWDPSQRSPGYGVFVQLACPHDHLASQALIRSASLFAGAVMFMRSLGDLMAV